MPAGRPAPLSQPIPEDVFGSFEPSPVESGARGPMLPLLLLL